MAKQLIAVITGDIVKSRSFNSEQFDSILLNLRRILDALTTGGTGRYELYRGDAFQVLFNGPPSAIRATVLISLALKYQTPHASVRQSIAIGIDDENSSNIRTSLSNVLVESGLQLERLKKQRIGIDCKHSSHNPCMKMLMRYISKGLDEVTESQAKALFYYIRAEGQISHGDIAEIIGTSRVNVTKLLNAANYQLLEDTIKLLSSLSIEA